MRARIVLQCLTIRALILFYRLVLSWFVPLQRYFPQCHFCNLSSPFLVISFNEVSAFLTLLSYYLLQTIAMVLVCPLAYRFRLYFHFPIFECNFPFIHPINLQEFSLWWSLVTITCLYIYIYIAQLYNISTRVQPFQSRLSHPSPKVFPSPKNPLTQMYRTQRPNL